jgi:hypothetical protein
MLPRPTPAAEGRHASGGVDLLTLHQFVLGKAPGLEIPSASISSTGGRVSHFTIFKSSTQIA